MPTTKVAYATIALIACLANADAIDSIKSRGYVKCGVNISSPGFSNADMQRNIVGLEIDHCRELALSIVGSPNAIELIYTNNREKFEQLNNEEFDVLYHQTSNTTKRENDHNIKFGSPYYIDQQKVLIESNQSIDNITDLQKCSICVGSGQDNLNLLNEARKHHVNLQTLQSESWKDSIRKINAGYCNALVANQTSLNFIQSKIKQAHNYKIIDSNLAIERFSPAVKTGNERLIVVSDLIISTKIKAEEIGMTQSNWQSYRQNNMPFLNKFMFSHNQMLNQKYGLQKNWQQHVIAQFGNYGESFDRHFGANSTSPNSRNLNALYKDGGLMVSEL